MLRFCTMTKSGRKFGWNISTIGLLSASSRSAYTEEFWRFWDRIHFTMMERRALCRFVYLFRAKVDEQFDRTCLLVCRIPLLHRLQEGLSVRFHRWRFEAVGRSWNRDFRENWKMHSGSAQITFDHSWMYLFVITPSIELHIDPCKISVLTCDLEQWFLKSWSADRRRSAELKSPVRETILEKKINL